MNWQVSQLNILVDWNHFRPPPQAIEQELSQILNHFPTYTGRPYLKQFDSDRNKRNFACSKWGLTRFHSLLHSYPDKGLQVCPEDCMLIQISKQKQVQEITGKILSVITFHIQLSNDKFGCFNFSYTPLRCHVRTSLSLNLKNMRLNWDMLA